MNGRYILNADGLPEPCDDLVTWAQWCGTANRKVASSHGNGFYISTVFLALDHSYGSGPLMLYETMVFEKGGEDVDCWRYATREDALEGHALAIQQYMPGASEE